MGMIAAFLLMIYIVVAVGIYKVVKQKSQNLAIRRITLVILCLIPTYDIIITNILGGYYCLTSPSTTITKKVEYPLSIYWEDNVYPGFNTEDQKLMVENYLDGVHLKTIALNGDDGKVYVYTRDVSKELYEQLTSRLDQEQKQLDKLEKEFDKYDRDKDPEYLWVGIRDARLEKMEKITTLKEQMRNLIDSYPVNEKVYTQKTMPKMNYSVIFNEVKLPTLPAKFLYSNETNIIDNTTHQSIAYNRSVRHFFYNIDPDPMGNQYYHPDWLCGKSVSDLEYELFDNYKWTGTRLGGTHTRNLHEILIQRHLKGEK